MIHAEKLAIGAVGWFYLRLAFLIQIFNRKSLESTVGTVQSWFSDIEFSDYLQFSGSFVTDHFSIYYTKFYIIGVNCLEQN